MIADCFAPHRSFSKKASIETASDWADNHGGRYVPLYEAKMIHQFDHRWATYDGTDSRDVTVAEKGDASFEPTPRYWVPKREVDNRLAAKGWSREWLMGWRDITNATNERTVIASILPRVAVGHSMPLCFPSGSTELACGALANLDSCHCRCSPLASLLEALQLKYYTMRQFPIFPPTFYTPRAPRLHHPAGSRTHLHLPQPRPLRPRSGP